MSKLFLVPTPVGNLEDITFRAIKVLKDCDVILAEDTRHTKKLLDHYSINNRLQPYHKFNEHKVVSQLVERIETGETMALVTDAGTPGISDPGFLLVRSCIGKGITVECLPGPTAFVPALVASGIPCERFIFEGFLPQKKGRQKRLTELSTENRTIVFYESPHRLEKSLYQLAETFGKGRYAAVCRELTKIHEEIRRDTLEGLENYYHDKQVKGEIVIIIAPPDKK